MYKFFRFALLLGLLGLSYALSFGQAIVSERLQGELANLPDDKRTTVCILLENRVDIRTLKADLNQQSASLQERTYQVITILQNHASKTQRPWLDWLNQHQAENIRPYWLTNVIYADLFKQDILALSKQKGIELLDINAPLFPENHQVNSTSAPIPNGKEPGLSIIKADKLWELGYTGYGRTAFGNDSGVDPFHPSLAGKFRGLYTLPNNSWYQWSGNNTFPFDCGFHGTHVTGTMLGLDRLNNDTIGVAFNALWIGAPILCGVGTADNIGALQWAINPDGNPSTTADMPDVINNSWRDFSSNECGGLYYDVLTALEAAGVAVVFSAGNEGEAGSSSITPPKNINESLVNVFCVAALTNSNIPADFSSLGPSICGGTGSLLIKPEVSAPGVNVRSCSPDNEYITISGTSMAAPHVSGAILLLKEAFPFLTGEELKLALYFTCQDLGEAGEDNTFGMGLIDVYAAYNYLIDQGHQPVSPAVSVDLLLAGVDAPTLNCDNESQLKVVVENAGQESVSGYSIEIFPYGGSTALAQKTYTTPLPSGVRNSHLITVTDLPTGQNNLTVRISLLNQTDERPLNNRFLKNIQVASQQSVQPALALDAAAQICSSNRAKLTASTNQPASVVWYDDASKNNLVGEGSPFVTAPLNQSDTFYAALRYDQGGMTTFSSDQAAVEDVKDRGIVFAAIQPLTIRSVIVYATEATNAVFAVKTYNDNSVVAVRTVPLEKGKNRVLLDFSINDNLLFQLLSLTYQNGAPLYFTPSEDFFPTQYLSRLNIISGYDQGQQVFDYNYYFYNWELDLSPNCPRQPLPVEVNGTTSFQAAFEGDTVLYLDQGAAFAPHNTSTGMGNTYLWDFGDGNLSEETEPIHNFTDLGRYYVTLQTIHSDGCSDVFGQWVEVFPEATITTTSDLLQAGSWQLFPNPAANETFLHYKGDFQNAVSLRLRNAMGQIVWKGSMQPGVETIQPIPLGGLPEGWYVLEAVSQEDSKGLPLIIRR